VLASPILPLGQIAPPSIQGQVGNLPMVGGVPGLPPPNMPGQLGNIPTMGDQKTLLPNMQGSYGNMPMTGGSYVHPPSTHGPTESGHLTDPRQIAEY
jgi:hypothetical protein